MNIPDVNLPPVPPADDLEEVEAPSFLVSFTPALSNTLPVDYSTNAGMKLYRSATEKLNHIFDGDAGNLRLFLQALQQRCDAFGWDGILTVPDGDGIGRHLISEYGRVTMENVTNHARTYVHTATRSGQNSVQLFTCIYDSLSLSALLKVSTDASVYRLSRAAAPGIPAMTMSSGACFLKLLITRCSVDTRATVTTLRKSLISLDVYMLSINCDVEKFNQHVRIQRDALLSRGEPTSDLLIHLFTAYVAVEDSLFSNYMVAQQDQYHDGRVEFSVDSLMQLALDKYNVLVEANKWNPTLHQDNKLEAQIIALTAKVEYFQARDSAKKGGTSKKERAKKTKLSKKWVWKTVPPKVSEPKSKSFDGKVYNWCTNHASWTVHTASECKFGQGNNGAPAHKKKTSSSDNAKKVLALSQAFQSIMNAPDDDDSNGETDGDSVSVVD
jgi:hypothetical protein